MKPLNRKYNELLLLSSSHCHSKNLSDMSAKLIFGSATIVGAIVVIIAAIVGWAVLPNYIDGRIEEEVRLINGTETWDKWSNITLPIQLKFTIFHVTNADDITNGSKPILKEAGPYVYDQTRIKFDLEEKADSIFYRQNITYVFNEDESIGSEDDAYDVINPAFLSVMNNEIVRGNNLTFGQLAGILSVLGQRIIMRDVTVKQLTFDGYDVNAIVAVLNSQNFTIPAEFAGGKFGLYRGRNGTDDGLYQINSGRGSSSRFGEIITWNHKTKLGLWNKTEPSHCDMINGTDGSIFPPFVNKDRILEVFITDLCRSLYLTYADETEVRGIKGYMFSLPPEVLENPRSNPNNRCFCPKENVTDCDFSGVLDVSVCRNAAPIVMSTPHFLGGDPQYVGDAGLNPENAMHSTVLTLEPNSGVLLQAVKRIQVNIRLIPQPGDRSLTFSNVTNMIFPILWVEETVLISESSARDLEDKLLKPIKTVNIARWTVLGIGIFITVVSGALLFLRWNKSKQSV